jgi:hypothetical protein
MKLLKEKPHCTLQSHYDQLNDMREACSMHATYAYKISVDTPEVNERTVRTLLQVG